MTGAGSGIGAGLAHHAGRLGMTVVLADIDTDAIEALRDELGGVSRGTRVPPNDDGQRRAGLGLEFVLGRRRPGGAVGTDVAAAAAQRSAMLDVMAAAIDPLATAATIFEQATEGRFYLLTEESVGAAMTARANTLAAQRHPPPR